MKEEQQPHVSTLPLPTTSPPEHNGGPDDAPGLDISALEIVVQRTATIADRLEAEADLLVSAVESHADSIQTLILGHDHLKRGQQQLKDSMAVLDRKLDTVKTLLLRALHGKETDSPSEPA